MSNESTVQKETLFGHPVGLYTLFFAEMWERFSYYGMRGLLNLYMIKGFLGYTDQQAFGVYGAYTALVYATGFIGGMLADRLLGTRRSVILGGLLMAAGHLLMTHQNTISFYTALALLVTGNGFFKPNISTTVGSLYPPGSPKKDSGFTIFYIGINLGGTLAALVCGYIGDKYGWHYGFGLATIGMLIGVAIFAAPRRLTQILILGGALATSISMLFMQNNPYQLVLNILTGIALAASGVIAFVALARGGLPDWAGAPPAGSKLAEKVGPFRYDVLVYLATLFSVPLFALLMQRNQIASYFLYVSGVVALGYLLWEAARRSKVERERMFVVIILTFFSIAFWACFEQAGSSMQFFEDRNVDRVFESSAVTQADVGQSIQFRVMERTNDEALLKLPLLTQEQLGRQNDDPGMANKIAEALQVVNERTPAEKRLSEKDLADVVARTNNSKTLVLTGLDALRDAVKAQSDDSGASGVDGATSDSSENRIAELQTLQWVIAPDNVDMGIGGSEISAPMFQGANPIFIMIFGLVFTALWSFLATRGLEPSVPVKFALALVQLGLGFVAMWYGAQYAADGRGMVAMSWVLLGIALHTTGELCTSPIGLSMVSNLSPKILVSTVMGAWWLGMAVANDLSSWIAAFTGIGDESTGTQVIPAPIETVHIYGHVFGQIAVASFIAAVFCFLLSPLLTKWMHPEAPPE